jgi:hypothetical protein
LATIREWSNTFVPINRIPLEVLSLIPTHLSREDDLLHAASVCRHWRRTFTQHAALWSQLDLTIKRSDHYVKTLLERAKGSALDIRSAFLDRADTLALLSPHAQQFGTLELVYDYWSDIQRFSEAASGPLPLLRTLRIDVVEMLDPETVDSPSLPLFNGAVNLKNFVLRSEGIPSLNRFAFPNLTTFELSVMPVEGFPISQLLNFLEASPTLRTIRIEIAAEILLGDVPPERVVVLPNVEIFSVTQDEPGYRIVAHVSCPSMRRVSLVHEQDVEAEMPQEIFPTSATWDTIDPRYMASTIDEVALGMTTTGDDIVSCSLSFLTPGSPTLELGYRMIPVDGYQEETMLSKREKHSQVFSHALKAIRTHPHVRNIKRLRIWDIWNRRGTLAPRQLRYIAREAAELFEFVGPLEELVLDIDLRPFLSPFFDPPELQASTKLGVFPSIKGLTITEQPEKPFDEECVAGIVELAKLQHMRGVPFERVVFHTKFPPVGMAERLESWVGAVRFL